MCVPRGLGIRWPQVHVPRICPYRRTIHLLWGDHLSCDLFVQYLNSSSYFDNPLIQYCQVYLNRSVNLNFYPIHTTPNIKPSATLPIKPISQHYTTTAKPKKKKDHSTTPPPPPNQNQTPKIKPLATTQDQTPKIKPSRNHTTIAQPSQRTSSHQIQQ